MEISIAISDDIAHHILTKWGNLEQHTLEALAIQAYRFGIITEVEVQKMLNFSSRWQTNDFLKRSKAYIDYTETDLLNDIKAIRKVKLK